MSVSPIELILRASFVFIYILVLLRLSGKRQMGQMSPTEFVAILLISNAVQNAMNGGDNSLFGGLLLAGVLILVSWVISLLTFRYTKFRHLFEGTPTLLVHRGKVIEKHLFHERMPLSELTALLRKQGIHNLQEIQTAVLEADGTLSVTRQGEVESTSPLD